MSTITVYTSTQCVQCYATKRKLKELGADYTEINVDTDNEARDFVMSLGYVSAPVVVAGESDHWSGFRPDRLTAAVAKSS